ncbi:hypothetical protein HG530_001415 [Fusarium avenaceum]|nr:hypothetical protein HG530_001415 [Fusarium avenaceum]
MSLTLAPYNDAMRIGQGFNSYTHEICIDGAVVVDTDGAHNEITQVRTVEKPSQVVSYSARAVEKLSDVIQTMNISYPHSIKKGSVTVSGSNSAIDEATFKSADINIVVTVKVTNQTTLIKNNASFVPMKGIEPASQAFNESYGDSYISGFIEGGEFTGIISIKVVDRSNVNLTVKKIKAKLDAQGSSTATEFTLNGNDSPSSGGSASVMENTESHIHVSWMGGGQIKNETTPWDVDSIFKAAAAFPQRVSERPQLTWAILTKYKSNRSFVEWASNKPVKTLEYDQVSSYTAELFDSYMDYKILLKYVQLVIDGPESYEAVDGEDALDTSVETLLGVRFAFRKEQGKIVEAISVLSRDPGILSRQGGWGNGRANKVLDRILSKTTGYNSEKSRSKPQMDSTNPEQEFDFSALIPAEIWRKWMPVPKKASSTSSTNKTPAMSNSSADTRSGQGPPPSDHEEWRNSRLQAQLSTLTKDMQLKTEAHTDQSNRFQDEIKRLKLESASRLEALQSKHNEDLEGIKKRQADFDTLTAGQKNEIEQTLQRLEKEKEEAVDAARKEIRALMEKKETQLRSDQEAALDKLKKENDQACKSLEGVYKKQLSDLTAADATLTTNSQTLAEEKMTLATQLSQKTSAYNAQVTENNNLKRERDSLVEKEKTLTGEVATLKNDKTGLQQTVDSDKTTKSKMTDVMSWAGLSIESRMDNCLPYSYSGWDVMIMMPHSRMALNANNESHKMAHVWEFSMKNEDEIFVLNKADRNPNTPWTITHKSTGNLLLFIDDKLNNDVRCRPKHDSGIVGKAAHWFIGRGSADYNTTWVLKNAQWPSMCMQLEHGWDEDGRRTLSSKCTNAGDANWVIFPLD